MKCAIAGIEPVPLLWRFQRKITTDFPEKQRLRNKCKNSILMTHHYPDLGSTSDWLKKISHEAWPIRSTTQIRVVTHHQYGISVLVSPTSFCMETSSGIVKRQLFSPGTQDLTFDLLTCSLWPVRVIRAFAFLISHILTVKSKDEDASTPLATGWYLTRFGLSLCPGNKRIVKWRSITTHVIRRIFARLKISFYPEFGKEQFNEDGNLTSVKVGMF